MLARHTRCLLDRRGGRNLLGLLVSLAILIRRREFCMVTYSREGAWRHRYRDGINPEPVPRSWPTVRQMKRATREIFLQEYVPSGGDVVVDVGAGVGTELHLFSELVGPTGRVIAIEAHPDTFKWLQRRCRVNGMTNVVPVNAALADRPGTTVITDVSDHVENTILEDGSGPIVSTITLDQLVRDYDVPRIDFLKMNIEGAERLAVAGMSDSARLVRHVCIGCHDFLADATGNDLMRTKNIVRKRLVEHGFTLRDRRGTVTHRAFADYIFAARSDEEPRRERATGRDAS